jgi:hypothetical protein
MRHVVVRYKVKPECLAEHEALIAAVFAQLAELTPAGLDYEVLRLADGLGFVHLATLSSAENPLLSLPAFKAFSADIKSRCEEPPVSTEAARLGSYRQAGVR